VISATAREFDHNSDKVNTSVRCYIVARHEGPGNMCSVQHVFELRLEGGTSFGFGPPRPGDCGGARILRAPDFCRDPELARYFHEQAKAQWELSPIDKTARQLFADETRLARVINTTGLTKGVGFIEANAAYGSVFVELSLPTTNFQSTGISTFEDWLRILRATKDDLNQEALLRLNFAPDQLQEADIAAFKVGKRLATTDVELRVRPRAIQWTRDD
jgi:hypothetical protein